LSFLSWAGIDKKLWEIVNIYLVFCAFRVK
jgi:hypothetical protein